MTSQPLISELDLAKIALRAAERELEVYLARTADGGGLALDYQRYSQNVLVARRRVEELEKNLGR